MPVSPPNYNVRAISPSALLARRDQEGPFEGLLDQAANFAFNSFLQQRSAEARRELEAQREIGRKEREHARDLRAGVIRSADTIEGQKFVLPGEDLDSPDDDTRIRVERVEGPPGTRFENMEFVRANDVQAARQQEQMAQPVESLFGRPTTGDVRRRDLFTPQGGQRSTEEIKGLARGDVEKIRDQIEAIPEELSAVREAAQAALRDAVEDENFTLAEEEEIAGQVNVSAMQGYGETARKVRQMERERKAEIAKARREVGQKFQIIQPSGAGGPARRRNLTPQERDVLALAQTGHGDQLSEAERQQVEELNNIIRPRIGAPDIRKEMRRVFVASGNGGTAETAQFVNWIQAHLKGPNDEIINEDLASRIREDEGGVTSDHILQWAKTANSGPYRAAFSLYSQAYITDAAVMELNNLGFSFPFGLGGARKAYEQIDPDFGDPNIREVDDSATGREPETAEEAEQREAEAVSSFEGRRQVMVDSISTRLQRGGDEYRQSLFQDLMLLMGDKSEVERKHREAAELHRTAARRDGLSDEEKQALREAADYYEQRADMADTAWSRLQAERDSVLIPAVRQTGALESIMNLDELPR